MSSSTSTDLSAESKLQLRHKMRDIIFDVEKLCALTVGEKEAVGTVHGACKQMTVLEKTMERSEAQMIKLDQLMEELNSCSDEIADDLHTVANMQEILQTVEGTQYGSMECASPQP